MAILKKTAKAEQAVAEAAVKSAAVEQAPAAVKEEKPASKTTRKASAKKAPAAKKTDAPKVLYSSGGCPRQNTKNPPDMRMNRLSGGFFSWFGSLTARSCRCSRH